MIEFFMHMIPPTITQQQHKINTKGDKPILYEPAELKAARAKLRDYLAPHRPQEPYKNVPLRLVVKWCFPCSGKHKNGEYRITKPDTDNLDKMLKDEMTKLKFWKDDAMVASEIIEKFWSDTPGIYVRITQIGRCSE